jgi:hypothetical protein
MAERQPAQLVLIEGNLCRCAWHDPCRLYYEDFYNIPINIMKNLLHSFVASAIVGTFAMSFVYVGALEAQTAVAPRGTGTAVSPPGNNLPAVPRTTSTANGPLASTPSSGVVNPPTSGTAPGANPAGNPQPINPTSGAPQYGTPNANSAQNATPASGQAPTQGATTNAAGQATSAP